MGKRDGRDTTKDKKGSTGKTGDKHTKEQIVGDKSIIEGESGGFWDVTANSVTTNVNEFETFLHNGFNNLVSRISNVFSADKRKKNRSSDDITYRGKDIKIAYRYASRISTNGILGLPPKFTALADLRLHQFDSVDDDGRTASNAASGYSDVDLASVINVTKYDGRFFSDAYQGQKWIDVYLKYASLVFFEIGRPIFFNGIGDDVREAVLSQQVSQNAQIGAAASDEAQKNMVNTLITFSPAGKEYAYGVKLLTDACAQLMDLEGEAMNVYFNSTEVDEFSNDRVIGGQVSTIFNNSYEGDLKTAASNSNRGRAHYRRYFNIQKSYDHGRTKDVDESPDGYNVIKGLMKTNGNSFNVGGGGSYDLDNFTNDIYTEIKGSTICVYADGGIESPLQISHETGPSSILAPLVNNTVMDTMAEIQFLAKDFDPNSTSAMEGKYEEQNSFFAWLKKVFGIITVGAKLVAPEVWKGSSSSKSFEVKMILQATSPSKTCIYREIMVPYMHILEMIAPRNLTTASSSMANRLGAYAPPYVVRGYCRGAVTINLGLPTEITVNKNPKDLTVDGLPTRLEITMTIKDLYGMFGVPVYSDTNTRLVIAQCMGLTEYLSALTGVVINQEKSRTIFAIHASEAGTYAYNIPKKWGARVGQALFSGYNERVGGMIAVVVGKINKIL